MSWHLITASLIQQRCWLLHSNLPFPSVCELEQEELFSDDCASYVSLAKVYNSVFPRQVQLKLT
jgi:hypothetical protein